jgi:cell shape-determining protein MreC
MRRWNWKHSTALAAATAVAGIASPGVSDLFKRVLTPLLSPLHGTARWASTAAAERFDPGGSGSVPAAEADRLAEENDRLRAEVIALRSRLRETEALAAQLAGVRDLFPGGRFALVPATVVSRDAAIRRDSVLAKRPADPVWDKVAKGQWAASRLFAAAPESSEAVDEAPVFWDAALVGQVELVAGGHCRIKLITDPDFQTPVEICDADGKTVDTGLMSGRGDGRMQVRFVERAKSGVAEGQWVRVPAGKSGLPTAMVVGRISRCEPDSPKSPLYRIEVAPLVDPSRLETVLIVAGTRADNARGTGAGGGR